MKMGKACLPMIRLRFGTKLAFDALAHPLQDCSGIAHGFIEHQELDPAIAFVQPQMVGRVRVDRLKRIGFYEDRPDIVGGFWRGSRSFSGTTAAEQNAAEQTHQHDTQDPDLGSHRTPPQEGCRYLSSCRYLSICSGQSSYEEPSTGLSPNGWNLSPLFE